MNFYQHRRQHRVQPVVLLQLRQHPQPQVMPCSQSIIISHC